MEASSEPATFCLISALRFHGLASQVPDWEWVASSAKGKSAQAREP